MRTVLLTTDTPHHVYFAREVARRFPWAGILVETAGLRAPFETAHAFEAEREIYEKDALLGGAPVRLEDAGPLQKFSNANDPAALAALAKMAPEVLLCFGTGKLSAPVLQAAPLRLNLHGGPPEHYRGLDTHLWAIYHGDFAGLVTTLHHLDEGLDTGAIVSERRLPLTRQSRLPALRAENTKACVDLTLQALGALGETGRVASRPQAARGRYYSFMPAVLKEVCLAKFNRHVAAL